MGLFNFIKTAGEKLFGTSEAKAADAATLQKEVEKHGLPANGVKIDVAGDKVTVSGGQGLTQEQAEKIILAVGNTMGVSQVDSQLVVTQEVKPSVMYTVKSGDTLSKISKEQYGDPNKYDAIFQANRPMLSHPDKIYPGQVLRIPPLDAQAA